MIHGIIFCLLNTNIDKHDNKELPLCFWAFLRFKKLQQY